MRLLSIIIVSAIIVAGNIGCATSGHEIKSDQVSQIVKGKTTEADLVRMFGQPQSVSTDSQGSRHLMWMHTTANAIPFAAMFTPMVASENLMATVGPDGVVQDFSSSEMKTPKPVVW